MSNPEVFRPKSSIALGAFAFVMCALFAWSTYYSSNTKSIVSEIIVALTIAWNIYTFVIKPKVTFCDEGIIVTNPLEVFSVGWNELILMDTKWALSFETKGFTAYAWAAIAPSRHKARNVHVHDVKGLNIELDGSVRAADSPRSDSGAARHQAEMRYNSWKQRTSRGEVTNCLDTYRKKTFQPLFMTLLMILAAAVISVS